MSSTPSYLCISSEVPRPSCRTKEPINEGRDPEGKPKLDVLAEPSAQSGTIEVVSHLKTTTRQQTGKLQSLSLWKKRRHGLWWQTNNSN